jgi:segregation and condensation protein A
VLNLETNDGITVSLAVFEGPLDLLLYLVRKNEVDIYDIPIATITSQYLEALGEMEQSKVEVAGEFLVMAATLLYIKSRTLLPADQQPPEADADEDDPRWELIRQLVEYKKFKEASEHLHDRQVERENIFQREPSAPVRDAREAVPLAEVGVFDLVTALQRVLARFEERTQTREIVEERYTVGDKMVFISEMVRSAKTVYFGELFYRAASRSEIVVTFLALLELIRLRQVRFAQAEPFGEIEISGSQQE